MLSASRNAALIIGYGPCRTISPLVNDLCGKYSEQIKFLEVDIDKAITISEYESIQSVPYFCFYFEGKKLTDLSFAGNNPSKLKEGIAKFADLVKKEEVEGGEGEEGGEEEVKEVPKVAEEKEYGREDVLAELGLNEDEDEGEIDADQSKEGGELKAEEPKAKWLGEDEEAEDGEEREEREEGEPDEF